MERNIKDFVSIIMRQEWTLSYGCTQPAAVGFAAAAAANLLGEAVESLSLTIDIGTYKNSLMAGLPGIDKKGPALAAAMGALIALPELALRIFEQATPELWGSAELLKEKVTINPIPETRGSFVQVEVKGANHTAEATIRGKYDHLSSCQRDGVSVFNDRQEGEHQGQINSQEIARRIPDPATIWSLVQILDEDDFAVLDMALTVNLGVAQASLDHGMGLGFGKAMLSFSHLDPMVGLLKTWVGAGIEARMNGESGAVMSSGGSGSNGIAVTLGPWAVAQALGIKSQRRIIQAIAIAHFINITVRARIGKAGPLCSGVMSSALGVGCAASWLMGGGVKEMDQLIRYMVNTQTGTLCDGAKPGCAYKICASLAIAVDAARMVTAGILPEEDGGFAGSDAAGALQRLATLSKVAYTNTDIIITNLCDQNRNCNAKTFTPV